MPKQNTKLQSEGAEFMVLGILLIADIPCYKAYINFPGYDLVAYNSDAGTLARIHVKSRFATNYDKSFTIKNFNCDFVVLVALNRGFRFNRTSPIDKSDIKPPDFYVFPIELVKHIRIKKINGVK